VNWKTEATTSPSKIREWWAKWPEANIGIATGSISGIFILDVDNKKDGTGEKALWHFTRIEGELPKTLKATTGSGYHLYFTHPAGVQIKCSASAIGAGLDVRGDGGYVVAPASLHANGRRYEWENHDAEVATAPDWLLSVVTAESVPSTEPSEDRPVTISPEGQPSLVNAKSAPLLEPNGVRPAGVIPEGQRNSTLFRLVCGLCQTGMPQSDVMLAAMVVNLKACSPPLPEDEVERTVGNARSYHLDAQNKSQDGGIRRHPLYWFPFFAQNYLSDIQIITMKDYQRGWHAMLTSWACASCSKKKFEQEMQVALYEFEKIVLGGQSVLINHTLASEYTDKLDKWLKQKEAPKGGKRSLKTVQENPEKTASEKAA
jgi:hypothetical protein